MNVFSQAEIEYLNTGAEIIVIMRYYQLLIYCQTIVKSNCNFAKQKFKPGLEKMLASVEILIAKYHLQMAV